LTYPFLAFPRANDKCFDKRYYELTSRIWKVFSVVFTLAAAPNIMFKIWFSCKQQ